MIVEHLVDSLCYMKQLRILTSVIISSSGSESSLEEAVAPVDPCALSLTLCCTLRREGGGGGERREGEGEEGEEGGGREMREGRGKGREGDRREGG